MFIIDFLNTEFICPIIQYRPFIDRILIWAFVHAIKKLFGCHIYKKSTSFSFHKSGKNTQ